MISMVFMLMNKTKALSAEMQHIWWMLWVWACTQEKKKKKRKPMVAVMVCSGLKLEALQTKYLAKQC